MIKTSKVVYGTVSELWGENNREAVMAILESEAPKVVKIAALELIAMITLGDKMKELNIHHTTAAIKTVEGYEAYQAVRRN